MRYALTKDDATIASVRDFDQPPIDPADKPWTWLAFSVIDPPFDPLTQVRTGPVDTVVMEAGTATRTGPVDTGSTPFEMNFNYRFETPTGLLEVILDGQTIFSDLMNGPVSEDLQTANILIGDPLLLDLVGATLEFRVTNPGSNPSTVSIDNVLFPGIVNGDFGDDTNGWLITATPTGTAARTWTVRDKTAPELAADKGAASQLDKVDARKFKASVIALLELQNAYAGALLDALNIERVARGVQPISDTQLRRNLDPDRAIVNFNQFRNHIERKL